MLCIVEIHFYTVERGQAVQHNGISDSGEEAGDIFLCFSFEIMLRFSYKLSCPTFSFFQKAGLKSEFEEDNITVFASSNSAWNKLPKGVMEYLKSDEVLPSFLFLE